MGRLTKEFRYGWGHKDCYDDCASCDPEGFCDSLEGMLNKLAHYEDLEEQGRLIEQKRGQWEYNQYGQMYCTNCGLYPELAIEWNYCPNCGAKLKELEGDNT